MRAQGPPLVADLPGSPKLIDPSKAAAVVQYLAGLMECRALQTKAEQQAATELVRLLGLESHHDPQKNWDSLKAIAYVLSLGDFESPVLDAGSGGRCVAARWLRHLGYKRLYACDLKAVDVKALKAAGIIYAQSDVTATPYADNFLQAVLCISVIEHNIPLQAFLAEMSRILRPGGLLLISTDYWSESVDCTGIFPYGEEAGEMKVFQPREIEQFVASAKQVGLELCAPFQPGTTERAVHWERVDREFTFAFLALGKRSA
jgi:SAM-dependent methyltransferase